MAATSPTPSHHNPITASSHEQGAVTDATLVLTCIFSIIGTLQLYTEPEVLAAISNNVSGTDTPNIYIYNIAFHNKQ